MELNNNNNTKLSIGIRDNGKRYHTNDNGTEIPITVITEDMYFNNKSYSKKGGNSPLFSNYLEYNGWLGFNGLARTDLEELDDNWRDK